MNFEEDGPTTFLFFARNMDSTFLVNSIAKTMTAEQIQEKKVNEQLLIMAFRDLENSMRIKNYRIAS